MRRLFLVPENGCLDEAHPGWGLNMGMVVIIPYNKALFPGRGGIGGVALDSHDNGQQKCFTH